MESIEIKNLIKKFNEHFNTINDIEVQFDLAKPVVIVGDEGSGKTTLFNIITGVDENYEGEVLVDGQNRRIVQNQDLGISYIMTEPVFLNGKSVYKNLDYVFKVSGEKLPKEERMARVKKVCEEYGITGELDKNINKCSRFTKMLVSLARAELKNAKLIIIDEPFLNLNNYEIASLWQRVVGAITKLSCGLIVADSGQNLALFDGFKIFKMDNGVIF